MAISSRVSDNRIQMQDKLQASFLLPGLKIFETAHQVKGLIHSSLPSP